MIKALASYQFCPGASPGVDVILYLVTDPCLQSRIYRSLRAHHPITPSPHHPGSTLPALLTCFVMRARDLHLVTVFDAILTSRQTCEKLLCLKFRWGGCSKKKKTIVLKHLVGVSVLKFVQSLALDFPYICV